MAHPSGAGRWQCRCCDTCLYSTFCRVARSWRGDHGGEIAGVCRAACRLTCIHACLYTVPPDLTDTPSAPGCTDRVPRGQRFWWTCQAQQTMEGRTPAARSVAGARCRVAGEARTLDVSGGVEDDGFSAEERCMWGDIGICSHSSSLLCEAMLLPLVPRLGAGRNKPARENGGSSKSPLVCPALHQRG